MMFDRLLEQIRLDWINELHEISMITCWIMIDASVV